MRAAAGIAWALCRAPAMAAARNADDLLASDLTAAMPPSVRDDTDLRAKLLRFVDAAA